MPVNNNKISKEESLIQWLMYKLLPYWPLFAILSFIFLFGGWAYLQYTTAVYEISATLIIKDENKGVNDSEIMESMNAFSSKKIVENEIEVIRSQALIRKVVNELYLYAPVFEETKIKQISAYSTSPISVQLRDPELLYKNVEDFDKIYFSFDSIQHTVQIYNSIYPVDKWVNSPFGVIKFHLNDTLPSIAKNPLYFRLNNPKAVTANLISSIEASSAGKLSTVVNLKLKDAVPQRGEDILNKLIFLYNQTAISERNILAANTLAFIEERINAVERDLVSLEKEIQQYKSKRGVVDLSEQGRLYLENIGDNDRKIADLNLQLAVLEKVENYVITNDNRGGMVPSTLGISDPVLSQLLEKLYNSEIQYEKLRRTTAENNPILASIAKEIERIRPGILENVRNQKVNLQTSLKNLAATSGKFNSALQNIPQQEKELLEISRRKSSKSELFDFLLQKKEEAALSYAPTAGDSRIVDEAVSSIDPVGPKSLIVYAISGLLACGVAIGFIFGKEVLNTKVLFRSEIEEATNVPVKGELLLVKQKNRAKEGRQNNRLIAEQFRDIRVGLGLYGPVGQAKNIMVTSSVEGEGKSFVSENLAISLASSGKKVVLVNFDLRKPSSGIFENYGQKGLAEFLAGNLNYLDLIVPTENRNLFVVPAGSTSESTTDILLDVDLRGFFEFLRSFDYIVIDTPPVGHATDAYLLSQYCDLSLYIVRHGHTPKSMLETLEQNIQPDALKNFAIIFNGIKTRGLGKTGYGYGYGYKQKMVNYYTA